MKKLLLTVTMFITICSFSQNQKDKLTDQEYKLVSGKLITKIMNSAALENELAIYKYKEISSFKTETFNHKFYSIEKEGKYIAFLLGSQYNKKRRREYILMPISNFKGIAVSSNKYSQESEVGKEMNFMYNVFLNAFLDKKLNN